MYNEMLNKYKEFLTARKLSYAHFNYMRIWFSYLQKNNIFPDKINQEIITNFFNTNSYSKNTYNSFIRAGRHFYSFLGISPDMNEWYKIKSQSIKRRIPTCLIVEDVQYLIKTLCSNHEDLMLPVKLETILWFMFYSGLRKAEILNLKRSDIQITDDQIAIKLIGKGDKQRIVYISDKYSPGFRQKLNKYFRMETETINAFNLTKGQLEYLMAVAQKYLTNKRVTPHMFRHSFARYLLDKGVPITYVSWLLGHSDIKTTMIYAHPTDDMIQAFMK